MAEDFACMQCCVLIHACAVKVEPATNWGGLLPWCAYMMVASSNLGSMITAGGPQAQAFCNISAHLSLLYTAQFMQPIAEELLEGPAWLSTAQKIVFVHIVV